MQTGKLNEWASPKDIILKLVGELTVKGGTGFLVEYFGSGVESLSATGMATVCNMGAEIGATCSIFPYSRKMGEFLAMTGRREAVEVCEKFAADGFLRSDDGLKHEKVYDQIISINLSELEPHINGPFSPDVSTPLSKFAAKVQEMNWPPELEVGLIGSCTNSSYEDMNRAASISEQGEWN
jgi:aconitate hydratase